MAKYQTRDPVEVFLSYRKSYLMCPFLTISLDDIQRWGDDYIQSHCVLHFYFETFPSNVLTSRSDYLMPKKMEFKSSP